MAKKLYRVSVEIEMVVLAEDEREAERVAVSNARYEEGGAEAWATEILRRSEVPREWMGSIPWGSEDDRPVCDLVPS